MEFLTGAPENIVLASSCHCGSCIGSCQGCSGMCDGCGTCSGCGSNK